MAIGEPPEEDEVRLGGDDVQTVCAQPVLEIGTRLAEFVDPSEHLGSMGQSDPGHHLGHLRQVVRQPDNP